MPFVVKAAMSGASGGMLTFIAQKTMYGGKHVAAGDTVFVFASENEGGRGLAGKGVVTGVEAVPRTAGPARQTPRVSFTIRWTASSARPLGRDQLKPFRDWSDGQPQTELNFKLYRQATNKLVGISAAAAAFLETLF